MSRSDVEALATAREENFEAHALLRELVETWDRDFPVCSMSAAGDFVLMLAEMNTLIRRARQYLGENRNDEVA
jgi:hypothetical protein